MRPLRLSMEGFGSYRDLTEVDFAGVDFFALTGPTGAGKSTVIDAVCFALYGTVPRWGREDAIRDALAPSANGCRVCLVFEAAGHRYAAVRVLVRSKRGQVQTREARLARLDASVPADAPLAELLEASAQELAEGRAVTAEVSALLGIGYEHFTQCVLLPQGRFADFLQANPGDRQSLLVQLLAYGVYEQVGQRARARASAAAGRVAATQARLDALEDATEDAERAAADRLAALAALEASVHDQLEALARLRKEAETAATALDAVDAEVAALGSVVMPPEAIGLTARIAAADADVAQRAADAELARDLLPDSTTLQAQRQSHAQRARLSTQLERQDAEHDRAAAAARAATAALATAEEAVASADALVHELRSAHRAVALAAEVRIGQPCPVCHQRITELPHHPVPADLNAAIEALRGARSQVQSAQTAARRAADAEATARAAADATRRQLAELDVTLAGAPGPAEVEAALRAIEDADVALAAARRAAKSARRAVDEATEARQSLSTAERRAWATLRSTRDRLVQLGAPAVDGTELRASWQALLEWAADARAQRDARRPELDATARRLRAELVDATEALSSTLAAHAIHVTDPARVTAALTEHRVRAEHELDAVRERRATAATLRAELTAHRDEREVAELLGNLLRTNAFERWLCGEALDVLVTEASATLMELSGGQYELARDERNEFTVIDYFDAGTTRPVHTLSGGETFQASLALALALSRQVVSLSGGLRELDSMFLDEGFGTLDEASLETVASTLQTLAEDSGRMVGIVTHVPALAERVPVQFAVSREGASSRIRRVQV
jgi:DNA repair protein SbcC/Rad50